MSNPNEFKSLVERQYEHDIIRKQVWANTATSVATCERVSGSATAIKWANEVLEGFDQKFPSPRT